MSSNQEIYKRAIEKMSSNREIALNGGVNCIPNSFSRFSRYWPGVEKGKYYIVTANSGVGKSKFAKATFVFDLFDQILMHPEWGIDLQIKYFCLEESKVNFMQTLMSYKLYKETRVRASVPEMNSVGCTVDGGLIENVENWGEYWNKFERMVDVIDDIRHPTGIFKYVEKWLLENGEWTMREREFTNNDTKDTYIKEVRDFYIPSHSNRYVIVVVDHVSLLNTEHGAETLHAAIEKLSSKYFLELRDKYNCSIVNVQQQSAESEKQQFSYRGKSIESKVEPTLSDLGDNKKTQRDADVVFGLFAPDRYEIEKHLDYDIIKFQDHYRSAKILKYRDGTSNVKVGMFFDGAVGIFEELPQARDITEEDYSIYLRRVGLLNESQS